MFRDMSGVCNLISLDFGLLGFGVAALREACGAVNKVSDYFF